MLTPALFDELPATVGRPAYDRSRVTTGIAHIGVGGFHRSHQAMYIDRLLNLGVARDWGILGIGVLPSDFRMRDALRDQECAYTLLLKHPDGTTEATVIGSIVEYLFAPDDPGEVIERLADPAIRIVSLTVTEGGYNMNPTSGEFDASVVGIVHDIADPASPQTVFGLVTEGLRIRRERGVPPFTIQSCDNIQGNGNVARRAFAAFAALRDPGLANWIEREVAFPNSMVDRITPQTTDGDRTDLALSYGIADAWPVVAEPFAQWVIEDEFALGRPPWELVGAQLVHDVMPYEQMKLRLLNSAHQAMSYFGVLLGYRWAHEAAGDPLIARLLHRYWTEEAIPTLPPIAGIDLNAYVATLLQRFRNSAIKDTLARLCAETSDRIPTFLLPVVRDRLAAGEAADLSAAIVASWARYAEGIDDRGDPIEIVDSRRERLLAAAARQRDVPTAFIEDNELFAGLATEQRFVRAYTRTLGMLHTKGARSTLEAILA